MVKINFIHLIPILAMGVVLLTGCQAIGSIFKAGVWTGTIGMILILLLAIYFVAKMFSGKKDQ